MVLGTFFNWLGARKIKDFMGKGCGELCCGKKQVLGFSYIFLDGIILTLAINPRTNTIAMQLTISAWFWMINSCEKKLGDFEVFLPSPFMAIFHLFSIISILIYIHRNLHKFVLKLGSNLVFCGPNFQQIYFIKQKNF